MFERFLQERLYLMNVSPRTIEWHQQSLNWLGIEDPTDADLKNVVLKMREGKLKPSSVNCRIRSINAYLHWKHGHGPKCSAGCQHLKISRLKEETKVLQTYSQHAWIRGLPTGRA
jgi:hypothetical protein